MEQRRDWCRRRWRARLAWADRLRHRYRRLCDQDRADERAAQDAGAKGRRQGRDGVLLWTRYHSLAVLDHWWQAHLRPHRRWPADRAAADNPSGWGALSLARAATRGFQAGGIAACVRGH